MMDIDYGEKARETASRLAGLRENVVTRTISRYPIPFAIAGAGIGLLIWRSFGSNGGSVKGAAGEAVERGREMAEQAGGVLDEARGRSGEWIGRARERAGEVLEKAKETAGSMGGSTQETARAWTEKSRSALQERPLTFAALGLAVGLVIGLAVPEGEREKRWLGELRRTVVRKAKDLLLERIKMA
ncbi:MAG TPA: hypothetical protein VLS90_05405 [Thermodesulfobacteriota bacterium]|nr:hypothetical protein [Thermodesulfobacteriota bacterium]